MKNLCDYMKKGDFVKLNPESIYYYQQKKNGKYGKIISDFRDTGYCDVQFKFGKNNYRKKDLIKVTKFVWLIGKGD